MARRFGKALVAGVDRLENNLIGFEAMVNGQLGRIFAGWFDDGRLFGKVGFVAEAVAGWNNVR